MKLKVAVYQLMAYGFYVLKLWKTRSGMSETENMEVTQNYPVLFILYYLSVQTNCWSHYTFAENFMFKPNKS